MSAPTHVPNQIDDGNWNLLQRMEGGGIEFPFSDKGDNVSWRQTLKYRMDRAAYRPRATMSRVRGDLGFGYLTKLGALRDVGCGLVEFEDTICALPNSRTEYGTFNYTLQFINSGGTSGTEIEEVTFVIKAAFEYEYFLNVAPPALIKPRVFLLQGAVVEVGGVPVIGNRLVAEDSTVTIWEGRIYERRTPYVTPSPGLPIPPP